MSAENRTPLSPALLVAGLASLAVAVWAVLGGPHLIAAGTLVGALAIAAVVVAGVVLIVRPGSNDGAGPADGSRADS